MRSVRIAACVLASVITASVPAGNLLGATSQIEYPAPIVLKKDRSGNLTSYSQANLAAVLQLAERPYGVRTWVVVRAPYNPEFQPGDERFEKQKKRIDKIKEKVVQRLSAASPATRNISHAELGPYFVVVLDRAGIECLVADPNVSRIYGGIQTWRY